MNGTIARVNIDRGFGFIEIKSGSDMFFHCSRLVNMEFNEQLIGRRVTFDELQLPDGRVQASNIKAAI